MSATIEERFWKYVEKLPGTHACWLWRGARSGGYGLLNVGGRPTGAHRISWMVHHGPIPTGCGVLHRCDNRPCVRPDHLYVGTEQDNADDVVLRGHPGGSRLTQARIVEMRYRYAAGGVTAKALADEYAISASTALRILKGVTWLPVGGPTVVGPLPTRARRGAEHGRATVDEAGVRAIREQWLRGETPLAALASAHGLTQGAVRLIVKGVSWRHIEDDESLQRLRESYAKRVDRSVRRKLTMEIAAEIRDDHRSGAFTQRELAARYGVSQPMVGYIVRRESWLPRRSHS